MLVFRSRIDAFFVSFIAASIFVIAIASFFPLVVEDITAGALTVLIAMFVVVAGIILWTSFSIVYVFEERHLLVKGGPFRSRIPYSSILKISPTRDIFTGYRILSSRDAIEIINNTTMFGTIKISPQEQAAFIAELAKRCPQLQIDRRLQ